MLCLSSLRAVRAVRAVRAMRAVRAVRAECAACADVLHLLSGQEHGEAWVRADRAPRAGYNCPPAGLHATLVGPVFKLEPLPPLRLQSKALQAVNEHS